MRVAIISLTKNGTQLNLKLCRLLHAHGYTLSRYRIEDLRAFSSINEAFSMAFTHYDALVFIGACGIAVRGVAPYLKSKLIDIPVVVCDELGQYAIPILSGHLGGANELSQRIAEATGGVAVITTATDVNHKFAVDTWAKENHLAILEPYKVKEVSSAILDGVSVGFYSDIPIGTPKGLGSSGKVGVVVSNRVDVSPFESTLHLLPKNLVLGVGCKKDTPMESIESLVLETLDSLRLSILSVVRVCSIDIKSHEVGLLGFCKKHSLEVGFYSSSELNAIQGEYSGSAFVESVTGVDCVCERSAVLGSMELASTVGNVRLVQKKVSKGGVTLAIAMV